MKKPTEIVRDAINEMLSRNERTFGAAVGRIMYLGDNWLVVPLVRPRVIEGQWEDVPESRTEDLFDLMDAYRAEQAEQTGHERH